METSIFVQNASNLANSFFVWIFNGLRVNWGGCCSQFRENFIYRDLEGLWKEFLHVWTFFYFSQWWRKFPPHWPVGFWKKFNQIKNNLKTWYKLLILVRSNIWQSLTRFPSFLTELWRHKSEKITYFLFFCCNSS